MRSLPHHHSDHAPYFELSRVLLVFIVLCIYHTTCLIALKFFGFWFLFCFIQSISSSWLALCPLKFRGLHWRQVSSLVVMVAVLDVLVSNKQFCLPKSGLIHIYICLVCNHTADFRSPISRTNHVSPNLGAVCGGTYREVINRVSQISYIFSIVRY